MEEFGLHKLVSMEDFTGITPKQLDHIMDE